MTTSFTKNIFASTYKDDWTDSANYHKILFNSGKALQARELTQLQTITQAEISRLGRHIFKQGAAVNPGGVTVNNAYEFIKLSGALPSGTVGITFTASSGNIQFEVLEALDATDTDPATVYVKYVNTSASNQASTSPIRVEAGDTASGGSISLTVQSTNDTTNPATGVGTKCYIHAGDFFVADRFVFGKEQSVIISKYTNNPNAIIGFTMAQSIVSASDDSTLYDNQGATPNTSSPGADRYKISLTMASFATSDLAVASDDSFVYVAKVVNGKIETQVTAIDSYDKIEDRLALRTREESGNYITRRFRIGFDTNPTDESKVDLDISPGVAYVDGYRSVVDAPISLTVDKPRTTISRNNDVIAADYGNYFIVSNGKGIQPTATYPVTLYAGNAGSGSAIGGARVGHMRPDGVNWRLYLFDIRINVGKNKRDIQSVGTGTAVYNPVVLENGKAILKEEKNSAYLFPLSNIRPKALSDISLTVQRRGQVSISGGTGTFSLTASGETFANTDEWTSSLANTAIDTAATYSGAGTTTAQIANASNGTQDIVYYVNIGSGAVRTKTLTEFTEAAVDSDSLGNLVLDKPDVYEIVELKETNSAGASIKNDFEFDDGQRDFGYIQARMVKKPGVTIPSTIYAKYKYFAHGATGNFFAANSYIGQVDYGKVPSYTTSNGVKHSLNNVLDFRSSVVNGALNSSSGLLASANYSIVNALPKPTALITSDIEYYLGRKIRVVINRNNEVSAIDGDPALDPTMPMAPNNSLDLFHINLNPFMINDSDVVSKTIRSKAYTMADIGKIEERIDKLEETTSLSLLEVATENFAVLDSAGNNRTKSGFFVDNFVDHTRSFTDGADYRASLDPEQKIIRPWFYENNVRLIYDSASSTGVIKKGDTVYLNHEHINYINQPEATETMNINPFAVVINEGFVELSPSSDEWTEVNMVPDHEVKGPTVLENRDALLWNRWRWNWVGREDELQVGQVLSDTGMVGNVQQIDRVVSSRSVREFTNNRLLDTAFIPFMRSRKINFRAFGLKPSTQVYAFFNNKPIADFVRSQTFSRFSDNIEHYGNQYRDVTEHPDTKSTLTTDTEGYVAGNFFIPNGGPGGTRFSTGTKEFKLLDISVADESNSTSIAKTPFTSTGILETRQDTFTTTRVLTIGGTTNRRRGRGFDPLAQTFRVEEAEGIYVTRIGVKFATKSTDTPVVCQIRPTVNGVPSSDDIVPNGIKVLSPGSITTSSDATTITYFEFDEPVLLNGNLEYCLVLLSDTIDYTVYVSKAGDLKFGSTEKRVMKQPSLGSLFKSQNSTTWTADQDRDLTFVLDRANFTSLSGTVVLHAGAPTVELLETDALGTTSGSATMGLFLVGHGLTISDSVTIAGATDTNGIAAANINGTRTVTKVDGFGFQFVAGSSDTASSTGSGGGSAVTITRNAQFDTAIPYLETLSPPQTLISNKAKFTTGKSIAGTETAYAKDTTYSTVTMRANNYFNAPRLVSSVENKSKVTPSLSGNETALTHKVEISTNSALVTPVVDLQRASYTLVNNLIDQQDTSTQQNALLQYASETNSIGGSTLAKHITQPVALENDAVGIKVLIAANRPSVTDFDVYYRTNTSDTNAVGSLLNTSWVLVNPESPMPADDNPNIFRDYRYLIGGDGGDLPGFSQFQIKVVFKSLNSAYVPVLKDLRVIALTT